MILFLRHGLTQGNLEKRYIGRTDEPLCKEGIEQLQALNLPIEISQINKVYASPMLRCRQTAEIIFSQQEIECVPDFRECDFGLFENKNYHELSGNELYQAWIDSNGTMPFPQGESRGDFIARCTGAFASLPRAPNDNTAFIVHGGTIMAILSAYAMPNKDYFDWQTPNGTGFLLEYDGSNAMQLIGQIGVEA